MTVLPYVIVSIVSSLGRLDYAQARTMVVRVGAVVASLWAIALGFAFLMPLAFPAVDNAAFFSTSLVERPPPFDFIALYIPANPFHSMANNVVPAVVLFSVIVGVALIGVERKQVLLDVLQILGDAVSRATRMVSRLTPYGLFAIAATAAGTLNVEQFGRLQIYLLSYVAIALLVSLWALPGLVAALTPVPVLDLLRTTRNGLITAFVAGDLFIVLPALIDAARTLLARHGVVDQAAATLPDVIVPSSFTFPHSGKLLSISFILFAGWFADAIVPVERYPELAVSGVVTFFGSLNAAVPFLLDLFRIPADTFQLFLATGVINSRFGTLLAAVHTVAVAIIGTCAMVGAVRWQRRAVVRYVATTLVLVGLVLGGARALFATLLTPHYRKDEVLAQMHMLRATGGPAVVHPSLDDGGGDPAVSTLDGVRRRGTLRVGYLPDSLPFAFFNERGDLVGFDIELAHDLASELGVRLHLFPLTRDAIARTMADRRCDLVMSGVAMTTMRASEISFSASYLDETLALLVLDHQRERFRSWQSIRELGAIPIAVPRALTLFEPLRALLPNATLEPYESAEQIFGADRLGADAVVIPAERGSAWTLLHPEYSVVVPEGRIVRIPLAYPLAGDDQRFASVVNVWLDLKRRDGTLDALYQYWILGKDAAPIRPRWSIARDVLHWID